MKFYEAIKAMMEDGRVVLSKLDGYKYRYDNKDECFKWFSSGYDKWQVAYQIERLRYSDFTLVEEPKPIRRLKVFACPPFTNGACWTVNAAEKMIEGRFPLKFDPATGECYVEIQE